MIFINDNVTAMTTRTHSPTLADRLAVVAAVPAVVLALAGCASTGAEAGAAGSGEASESADGALELAAPRLVVSYDGGVLVLEGDTLEPAADLPLDGYLRVNPAGDGRHVLVSTEQGFEALDTGLQTEAHGDHAHYYGSEPGLTGLVVPAEHPGHVTVNEGETVLFADGTGEVTRFESDELEGAESLDDLDVEHYPSPEAHHGVAVAIAGGGLLTTLGDSETRTGAVAFDSTGAETARNEQCPGVHGETVAGDGVIVVGCEDGALVYRDGAFTKVQSPDAYGRIGNQAGSPESPIVLGDYKVDPDAELERPTRVTLVDTETASLRLVELGTSYSFRSLARGPHGEALVLGTDGAIHVIDPVSGAVTATIPVVAEWTEPLDWQQPRPMLRVDGHRAYVTDPANDAIHLVDLDAAEVVVTTELPHTPDELSTVATGH